MPAGANHAMSHTVPLPFRQALPWLCFVTVLFFMNFLTRVIFSPLMLPIEEDLGIHHAQAGRLYFFFSAGYALGLFASGFLSTRMRHRDVIALSATAVGISFMAISQLGEAYAYELLATGLALFGVAGGLYLPSGIATLTSLVRERDYGKAFSVHEMAPNLSLFLAPLLVVWLSAFMTWREVLLLLGVASLAAGVAFKLFARGGTFTGHPPDVALVRRLLGSRPFWGLLGLFFIAVSASFAPYAMLPLFLTDVHAFEDEWANRLLAYSRIAGPFAAFGAGWLVDRLGAVRTVRFYLLSCGIATAALGALHGEALVVAVLLQAVLSVTYFPAGFSLLAKLYVPETRSVVISCMIPLAILLGNGVTPAMMGWAGRHGHFEAGFLCLGGFMVGFCALIPLLFHKDSE